jgi:hypothetical protein
MFCKRAILVLAITALGACNTMHKRIGMEDPALGEAVKYNSALQTVDPDPAHDPADRQPGYHGEKGQKAVERYRTDKVKPVERMGTTQSTSGTGSGSGSGPR